MTIVCRLMSKDELSKFLVGEEITKGVNGERRYEKQIGNAICFTPLKYKDKISEGDIASILKNMNAFVAAHAFDDAKNRNNSPLYLMVAIVDDDNDTFLHHWGGGYYSKYGEYSKELLVHSYSSKTFRPFQLYQIENPGDILEEIIGESPEDEKKVEQMVNDHIPKIGFPIIVSNYIEAMLDCLVKIYPKEKVIEIFKKMQYISLLEYAKEMDHTLENEEGWDKEVDEIKEKLYGKERSDWPEEYDECMREYTAGDISEALKKISREGITNKVQSELIKLADQEKNSDDKEIDD